MTLRISRYGALLVWLLIWPVLLSGCSGDADHDPNVAPGTAGDGTGELRGESAHDRQDATVLEDDAAGPTATNPMIRGMQEQLANSPVFRDQGPELGNSLAEADRILTGIKQENLEALRNTGRQLAINPNRPHILLIVADDLGVGDLGCYGQQQIQTPHLDALAEEGTRCTNFYAGSPYSDASWWCLLAGRYTAHSGQSSQVNYHLAAQTVTLAEVMWQGSYDTAYFGHWYLPNASRAEMPHLHGFEHWAATLGTSEEIRHFPEFVYEGGSRARITANADGRRGVEGNAFFTQRALSFLRERSTKNPFFMVVAYTLPHPPHRIPTLEIYEHRDWTDGEKAYASAVTQLDQHVGQLLGGLRELKLDARTAVFLFSDNAAPDQTGGTDRFGSNGAGRGAQGVLYEGGLRIPLLARWPGHFPAAQETDFAGAVWDLLPTLADLGSVTRRPARLDGTSLLDVLLGKQGPAQGRMYWETRGPEPSQAVRLGRWKAVRPAGKMEQSDIELYDLQQDPQESQNLASQHPEIIAEVIQQ